MKHVRFVLPTLVSLPALPVTLTLLSRYAGELGPRISRRGGGEGGKVAFRGTQVTWAMESPCEPSFPPSLLEIERMPGTERSVGIKPTGIWSSTGR